MSDCTHCWHTPGLTETLASYPPQHKEVCCHCGTTQYVRDEPPPPPEGHGKFYPRSHYGEWKVFW